MDSTGSGANEAAAILSGGAGQATTGATVESRYHDRTQDIVGVNVEDLREFKSASVEEFWQFVVGEFLAAGAFWLGVERFVTEPNWQEDALFWICVAVLLAGCVIGYFGYRQLSRRQSRIDRIINATLSGTTDST